MMTLSLIYSFYGLVKIPEEDELTFVHGTHIKKSCKSSTIFIFHIYKTERTQRLREIFPHIYGQSILENADTVWM